MRDRADEKAMEKFFRDFPVHSIEILNDILENKEQGELLVALRQLSKSFGGVHAVAAKAKLNRNQLFRVLSRKGNPAMRSLSAILKAMGMRLAVDWVARPEAPAGVTWKKLGFLGDIQQVRPHPGLTLRDEFLVPLGITQGALAKWVGVSPGRIGDIILGRRGISADTALRLGRFFGNSGEYWMQVQQMYELSKARLETGRTIDRDIAVWGGG